MKKGVWNRMTQAIQKELNIIKESVLKTVPAEAIYLFGSHAYGTPHKDSDLDIYVVIPDTIQENPLNVGAEILYDVCRKIQAPVDVLVGKRSVFDRRKEWAATIQHEVAAKGELFYGYA